jgi:hypothetical protein
LAKAACLRTKNNRNNNTQSEMIQHLFQFGSPKATQFMPTFSKQAFDSELASTMSSTQAVVNAAAKAGKTGGTIAAVSMKSIRDNPCEKSPAPGCVTP